MSGVREYRHTVFQIARGSNVWGWECSCGSRAGAPLDELQARREGMEHIHRQPEPGPDEIALRVRVTFSFEVNAMLSDDCVDEESVEIFRSQCYDRMFAMAQLQARNATVAVVSVARVED